MPGAGYEVRGNGEMFPLNGPCWSLFFEYLGNILYALFIHRLSNKALAVLTILLGVALASFAIFDISGYGNMGVGWTLDGINFGGGLLRMLFLSPWACFVAQLQAYQGERCFLDMCHCIGYLVFSALLGRCNTGLYKWHL